MGWRYFVNYNLVSCLAKLRMSDGTRAMSEPRTQQTTFNMDGIQYIKRSCR